MRYAEIEHLAQVVHRLPLVSATLEITTETPFLFEPESGDHHLTIVAPGVPGAITVRDAVSGQPRNLTGEEFALSLSQRMRQQFGGAGDHIRSISLLSCRSGCPGRSAGGQMEPSFAEDFAGVARSYFPRLHRVIASPYDVGITELRAEGRESEMGLVVRSNAERESVMQRIDPENFFSGDLPRDLFGQPVPSMFDGARELTPAPGSPNEMTWHFSDDSNRVHSFMDSHRNEFTESVLQDIRIGAPITGGAPD